LHYFIFYNFSYFLCCKKTVKLLHVIIDRPINGCSYSTRFVPVSTAACTLFMLLGLAYLLFDSFRSCLAYVFSADRSLHFVSYTYWCVSFSEQILNPMFKIWNILKFGICSISKLCSNLKLFKIRNLFKFKNLFKFENIFKSKKNSKLKSVPFEVCSIWNLFHLKSVPFKKCSIWKLFKFKSCSILKVFKLKKCSNWRKNRK
jgi:hypothetical protein